MRCSIHKKLWKTNQQQNGFRCQTDTLSVICISVPTNVFVQQIENLIDPFLVFNLQLAYSILNLKPKHAKSQSDGLGIWDFSLWFKNIKIRQDKIYFESARYITINISSEELLNRLFE